MGYQKYLAKLWNKPKLNFGAESWRNYLVKLRKEPAILRVENPTRPDRAHALGFKAKEGFLVVRSRVTKGGSKRPKFGHGRKPKRYGRFVTRRKSDQLIAEERVARFYPNCEVLNSYWVGEDGRYKWYEVILVDRVQVSKYDNYKWLKTPSNRGRVYRGLTAAGKESRGLTKKGAKRAKQFRPSKRSRGTK